MCRTCCTTGSDGRLKMWITMHVLEFSARASDHCSRREATYRCVDAAERSTWSHSPEIHGERLAIIVAPRLSYTLMKGRAEPPLGVVWGDPNCRCHPRRSAAILRNIFTGESL